MPIDPIQEVFGLPVNSNGEVVAIAGSGGTTVAGILAPNRFPVDQATGKLIISGLSGVNVTILPSTPVLNVPLVASLSPGVVGTFQFTRRSAGGVTSNIGPASSAGVSSYSYTPQGTDVGYTFGCNVTSLSSSVMGTATLAAGAVVATSQVDTFGDSFTFGVGASSTANSWAVMYAAARGLPLLNTAISGTIMENRIDSSGSVRADNGLSRYTTALLGSNLSTEYAILYGFNDARYTGAPATINVANFTTDYRTVLTGMIAAGVPASAIRIGSPGYITDTGLNTGSAGFTGQTRAGFEAFVTAVKNLATEFGVTYVPVYEYMRDNGGASLIGTDLIHPNDAGHAAIKNIMLNPALYTGVVSDTTAPTALSASVANATPTKVTVTMSEALNASFVPAASAFAIAGHTVSAVAVSGSTVTLTVDAFVNAEAARTLAYTQPATNGLRDSATTPNLTVSFSNLAIVNNVAAAGATIYPQVVSGFTGMTEAGTGPYTYAGDGTAALGTSNVYGGILNQSLQNGVDGSFSVKATVRPTTKSAFLGLQSTATMGLANAIPYTIYASAGSNNYVAVSNGVANTVANTVAAAVGDIIRLRRTGTSIIAEVSKDGGTSYTTIYTWTGVPTTQLYYSLLLTGTAAVDTLTTVGLA